MRCDTQKGHQYVRRVYRQTVRQNITAKTLCVLKWHAFDIIAAGLSGPIDMELWD